MIRHVRLTNFKSAENLRLRLGALTVLAGLNGSGKSSVLQALCVLKQSIRWAQPSLRLRGPLVQLGTYADVITEGAENDTIGIEIGETDRRYCWKGLGKTKSAVLTLMESPTELPDFLRNGYFQALPADRIVPRNSFGRSPDGDEMFGPLGSRGEFVVEYLVSNNSRKRHVSICRQCPNEGVNLTNGLVRKAAPTLSLMDQVSGWMQQLSPGVQVGASELDGTDEVALSYRYVGRSGISESSRSIRPSNVGFGLTYSLPIVVACLIAEPGSLLLLENPEAHLHPQGQAALGDLVARTAADGVQIILETHSDHVLNGIRLAAKRQLIEAQDVAIHFLTRSVDTGFTYSESPVLLPDGRLSDWPRGFFDQWDLSVDLLVGD